MDDNHRVRSDVLVLLDERAASLDITGVPVPGAPDLAVEIISPSERSSETQQKLHSYLLHGTREVWQVYPKSKSVVIHRGGTSTTITSGERIETSFLPGLARDMKSLF